MVVELSRTVFVLSSEQDTEVLDPAAKGLVSKDTSRFTESADK